MTAQAVPASVAGAAKAFRLPAANSAAWPLLAIGLLLIMQLSMVFTRAVNWDEFWFYYHVADFERGTLAQPLQSLHVRLFAWLPGLPGSGVEKIQTARVVMLACEVVTLFAIYTLARRFVQRPAAVLATLLYLSAGYVLQHGFSFRTDPMANAALMSALAILGRARLNLLPLAAFALLIAVAGMITIKTVLYAPAFLGLAWMRWSEDRFSVATALRLVGAAASAVATFLLLYVWHSSDLTTHTEGTAMAASSSSWMFFLGLPPFWQMAVKAALTAPVLSLLVLAAPLTIWKSGLDNAAKWGLFGLWLPVTLPLFYTNSAAYFYVFMLAPVAVSVVVAAQRVVQRYSVLPVTAVLAVLATGAFAMEDRLVIHRQAQVVEAAGAIFTEGVAYFDFDGMISRFDKANDFLTPWGLAQYAQSDRNIYRETMERRAVPVLLANAQELQDVMEGRPSPFSRADAEVLRGNFVPYWGPYYVAGKRVDAMEPVEEEFLVPGTYLVTQGVIAVDGRRYGHGESVEISRGHHTLEGTGTLRWGTDLGMPGTAWDDGPLYVNF